MTTKIAGFIFMVVLAGCMPVSCNLAEAEKRHAVANADSATRIAWPDKDWINEANAFISKRKMNKDIAVFINLGLHSGYPRLTVYHFPTDSVLLHAMVSHGCGPGVPWGRDLSREKAPISNEHDSHCSSVGRYRIGERDYSNWGIHVKYWLHGLDSSNSNALSRVIVIHGWDAVPDFPCYPRGTPEGWGCPAVSNNTMRFLDSLLSKRRNVLMWVRGAE